MAIEQAMGTPRGRDCRRAVFARIRRGDEGLGFRRRRAAAQRAGRRSGRAAGAVGANAGDRRRFRLALRRRGGGAELSGAPGAHRDPVLPGRHDRHAGPDSRAGVERGARPAVLRGQPPRCGRHDRHRVRGEVEARRAHAAPQRHAARDLGEPLQEPAVSRARRLHPDRAGRRRTLRAGRPSVARRRFRPAS